MTNHDDAPRGRRLSILTVFYNSAAILRDTAPSWRESLESAGGQVEVLIFDNSPDRKSLEVFLSLIGPQIDVRYWQDNQNIGFARAINELARQSASDWLLLLNPDVFLRPGSLKTLIQSTNEKSTNAVHSISLRRPNGAHYGGIGHNALGMICDLRLSSTTQILGPTGAATLVRRNLFLEMGGYEQDLDMWLEDADFAIRLYSAGYRTVIIPLSLEHIGGHSVRDRKSIGAKAFLIARNRIWILRRRYTTTFNLTLGLLTVVAMLVNAVTRKAANGTFVPYLAGMLSGFIFEPPARDRRFKRLGLSEFISLTKRAQAQSEIGKG